LKQNRITDLILLGLILVAGVILRFYHYSHLPFTFDEFSALFRTRFDNFSDLIHLGVTTTDMHPAGIQVFMYYWVKCFDESEMVVKFPFLIFGIISIYITFRIGREWFNPTVGLIAAMFIAFLQYPITYSQYARPYSSGLFFSLIMVFFWSKAFFQGHNKQIWYIILYVLSGAFCAYNHHFSLFFLAVVWISGVFFLKKNQIKLYLFSGIAIFILYIPHLEIFFIQLNKGGVESWLSKPTPLFYFNYIKYILHYNISLYIITGLLLLTGFILSAKKQVQSKKFRVMMFLWLVITYGTAYFYSVYVNAVLQYSVILFVFPFLVILLFSFIRDLKPYLKVIIVLTFGFISVYSLITGRQHYFIQYESGYRETLVEAEKIKTELGDENVTTLIYLPEKIRDYYTRQLHLGKNDFVNLDSLQSFKKFESFIKDVKTDHLTFAFAGLNNLEYYMMIKDAFPFLIHKRTWYLADLYVFSKERELPANPVFDKNEIVFHKKLDFTYGGNQGSFMETGDSVLIQPTGIKIDPSLAYFNLIEAGVDTLVDHKNNYLFIKLNVFNPGDEALTSLIISEISSTGITVDWRAAEFGSFVQNVSGKATIYKAVKLPDIMFDPGTSSLKIYIWNKNSETLYLENFEIYVTKGNPVLYGLLEEISD